ncbi:hypothetical protein CYLTODRAFT_453851 [Cylindrobasidium torrendii FP15055 ss-10]|uniref:C2H2-type domain-containing protein n=1 Tax=Cylindrobasidium torrendii FP15055 ss-10 TaxID=1314674 RepID=A0A0D7BCA9_9AGAR|nr:hypothetical protein CYLTODRAFT_453851 [Cylindrobasidium torrendii FP15055 ss-10]
MSPSERERKHACSMCQKRFDRPSTLKKHLLVHTGEKAYQCDCCGRRFGVASNLNRHVKRCVLRATTSPMALPTTPSAAHALISSSTSDQSDQTTPSPPPAKKRRRSAPTSSTSWVPPSLRGFILMATSCRATATSLASPVDVWDERDSYAPAAANPYHPSCNFSRLPGAAIQSETYEWSEIPELDSYSDNTTSRTWGMGVLGVRVF